MFDGKNLWMTKASRANLVDFHSLYEVLDSQVYGNGLKLWISNVKVCIDKWKRIK